MYRVSSPEGMVRIVAGVLDEDIKTCWSGTNVGDFDCGVCSLYLLKYSPPSYCKLKEGPAAKVLLNQ